MLSHFFMVSADIQIIKREARTQLFIIDQSSVSIYFYLTRLPCENYSVGPRR